MAASTTSTVPPLSDRSNTLDASVPHGESAYASIQHSASKRHLFPHLDSSEATPSENSSIYDARRVRSESEDVQPTRKRARSRTRSRSLTLPGERRTRSGTPNGPGIAVRFINRPDATPLTTILEQKSIATLRSRKSLLAAACLIASKQSREADPTGKQTSKGPVKRRQAAISIDEATLRELHQIIENQIPVDRRSSSASSSECVNEGDDPARPGSPPHPPHFRSRTPHGVPRWPGDLPTLNSPAQPPVSRARSFGYALREIFRPAREPERRSNIGARTAFERGEQQQPRRANPPNQRTGRAYWAPPPSGHSTFDASLPGCAHATERLDETRAETGQPRDSQAGAVAVGWVQSPREGGRQQHLMARGGQPQEGHGSPPNVTQAAHGKASRLPAPAYRHPQPNAAAEITPSPAASASVPDSAAANSASLSLSSTTRPSYAPSAHSSLIPEPLQFSSPPHSRRHLDQRVPDSPYDRVSHMLGTTPPQEGQQQQRESRYLLCRDRDDTASRYTAAGIPIYHPDAASLRNFDTYCSDGHRIVSIDSTAGSTARAGSISNERIAVPHRNSSISPRAPLHQGDSPAVVPPQPPPSQLPPSSASPTKYTLFPQSHLPPHQSPKREHPSPSRPTTSPTQSDRTTTTVIRSAALAYLLPIAVAEGIVHPHPFPRPASLISRAPSSSSRDSTTPANLHAAGRSRGASGSSDTYYTASPMPTPTRTATRPRSRRGAAPAGTWSGHQQVVVDDDDVKKGGSAAAAAAAAAAMARDRRMSIGSGERVDGEKRSWGEDFGWLLRVCFCQPVGGIEDIGLANVSGPRPASENGSGSGRRSGRASCASGVEAGAASSARPRVSLSVEG